MVELPLSLTWTATGNNVLLEADTSRRTLQIRLDSPEENPELRRGFQIPQLVAHVKQQRAALVAAGLTILSAYHAAGRPRMNLPAWGSFDAWSALIREAVVWCGLPDLGQTREELAKRSDVMAGVLQILINQWPNIDLNGEGLTTSELLKSLEERRPDYESIREAVCELCGAAGDKLPSTRSLGNRLRRVRGRVVNGMALDSDDEHGKARWVVRTKRDAESFKGKLESLLSAKLMGNSPDRETSLWLSTLDDDLHAKLAAHGLVESRRKTAVVTLEVFVDQFIAGRTNMAQGTLIHYRQAKGLLLEYFEVGKVLADITPHNADQFRSWLSSLLNNPTGLAPVARGSLHDFGIQLELSSAKT